MVLPIPNLGPSPWFHNRYMRSDYGRSLLYIYRRSPPLDRLSGKARGGSNCCAGFCCNRSNSQYTYDQWCKQRLHRTTKRLKTLGLYGAMDCCICHQHTRIFCRSHNNVLSAGRAMEGSWYITFNNWMLFACRTFLCFVFLC